ncbi:MAG: hypothetical protein ACM3NT_04435 [Methylocystaceae bacterium]
MSSLNPRSIMISAAITLLLLLGTASKAAALDASIPYLGNMLLQTGTNVEIVSTLVKIDVTGDRALVTCDYQLNNQGTNQTVTAGYPVLYQGNQPLIYGFAVSKNSQPLSVKVRRQPPGSGYQLDNETTVYNVFSFPLAAGESCTVRNSYFVSLPTDTTLGRLIVYNNHQSGGWKDTGLKKFDIKITNFKPYFNVMLYPELGALPQTMDYKGTFSYLIDPRVQRQDIYFYYQLRGPEAALKRLAVSKFGASLLPSINSGNYQAAYGNLQLFAANLTEEGVLSPVDVTMLKLYLAYQNQDYEMAADILNQLTVKDGTYIYYHILNSLQLNQQTAAGQSLRDIGQFKESDLTGVSVELLKNWAEKTISQYLARPAAPVPVTTARPKQHTAVLLLSMGLVVISSAALTAWMRRK